MALGAPFCCLGCSGFTLKDPADAGSKSCRSARPYAVDRLCNGSATPLGKQLWIKSDHYNKLVGELVTARRKSGYHTLFLRAGFCPCLASLQNWHIATSLTSQQFAAGHPKRTSFATLQDYVTFHPAKLVIHKLGRFVQIHPNYQSTSCNIISIPRAEQTICQLYAEKQQ